MPTKHNATGRRKGNGRFVMLDHALLNSEAYRSLSPTARALLVELNMIYMGSNNGALFLSQRDAADRLGLKTHPTAGKAFRELEDRCFIRTRVKGSFNNKTKLATSYILTQHEYNDKPATRAFQNWKPPAEEKQRVRNTTASGRKKKPTAPADWPDGWDNQSCNDNSAIGDGADNCSTYNMPGGGLTADEQLSAGSSAAA